jgi:uncharacterized YccA/Bax inhibitor family protein
MPKMIILTTENIIEGTIGAITMIITANIIKKYYNPHLLITGGISFLLGWFIRKISLNIMNYTIVENTLPEGIVVNV